MKVANFLLCVLIMAAVFLLAAVDGSAGNADPFYRSVIMGIGQLLVWAVWAGLSRHPSRFKLWTVAFGMALTKLLEIYDFPPQYGYFDAHPLWHMATIPLACLWWSFINSDAEFRTDTLMRKVK